MKPIVKLGGGVVKDNLPPREPEVLCSRVGDFVNLVVITNRRTKTALLVDPVRQPEFKLGGM